VEQKRVDIYLALAAFFQLLFIAFGSAFATEIISERPRGNVIFFSSLPSVISILIIVYFYTEVFSIAKQKKL